MWEFVWLAAVRVLGACAILIAPLPALWLSGHVDRWDWSLLGMPAASAQQQLAYQYWDKSLDTFTLAICCIVALRWKDPLVRRLAIATFAWRAFGVLVFMATGQREVLVAFPNVFERLFFFYLLFRLIARQDIMLSGRADAILVIVALTLPKVADEYFVHVAARPWQTISLLPASLSTPDREYWVWLPIMLALPVVAMVHLLWKRAPASEKLSWPAALFADARPFVTPLLKWREARIPPRQANATTGHHMRPPSPRTPLEMHAAFSTRHLRWHHRA
jgi:hypothetical protein